MPNEEHNLRNIGNEHTPSKSGLGLPDFTIQNVIIVVLALVLAGFAVYVFKPQLFKGFKLGFPVDFSSVKTDQKKEAKRSAYSAVFLANNQVYFGKIGGYEKDFLKLKEVYYLRANDPLQPPAATGSAQPDLSLIKLGNELHGPTDEIRFNKDQILYTEDMKTDSRIVKAIEEFKNRPK